MIPDKLERTHEIYQLTEVELFSVSKSSILTSERDIEDDKTHVEILKDLLQSGTFYFSFTYDLSNSLQR